MKNILSKTFGVLAIVGGFALAAVAFIGGLITQFVWFMLCAIEGGQ